MDQPPGPAVVLTREPDDNRELAGALAARGVPVREVPCTATRWVGSVALPDGADAVAFTSRRGVVGLLDHGVARALAPGEGGQSGPGNRGPLVAAVGAATAGELAGRGVTVDVVAEPPQGVVLARMLAPLLPRGGRVVLVRGDLRAGDLDAALHEAGFSLAPLVVYENVAPEIPRLAPFPVAAVFVASPSAARRLVAANPWVRQTRFLTIGPTTASAVRDLGVGSVRAIGSTLTDWIEHLCAAHRLAIGSVT